MSRPVLLLLTLAAVLGAACDALQGAPGDDFAVAVLDPLPLQVVARVEPVPLRFSVRGCDAFDVALRTDTLTSHRLTYATRSDGAFEARVPVAWLHEEGATCLLDTFSAHPIPASLAVTCKDANRTAAAAFQVDYRPSHGGAWRYFGNEPFLSLYPFETPDQRQWSDPVSHFFPGPNGNIPYVSTGADRPTPGILEPPFIAPVVVTDRNGDRGAESVGCAPLPELPCEVLAFPAAGAGADVEVRSNLLRRWEYHFNGPGLSERSMVPGDVIDLAFTRPEGDLLILGQAPSDAGLTQVLSVIPADAGAFPRAQVLLRLDDAALLTRFSRLPDGHLGFVTLPVQPADGLPASATLWLTGGSLQPLSVPLLLPAAPLQWGGASLSPDGSRLVVQGGPALAIPGPAFFGSPDGGWAELHAPEPIVVSGVAWFSRAVAVWHGLGSRARYVLDNVLYDIGEVRVHELAPPHQLRFTYQVHPQPGARGPEHLLDVQPVGDRYLALTTNTGVRILDLDGGVVAGADPLPCGQAPTTSATAVSSTRVIVGSGQLAYFFDLP